MFGSISRRMFLASMGFAGASIFCVSVSRERYAMRFESKFRGGVCSIGWAPP